MTALIARADDAYTDRPTEILLDGAPTLQVLRRLLVISMRRRENYWGVLEQIRWKVNGRVVTGALMRAGFRKYRLPLQQHRCCYCRIELIPSMGGRQIEHILPCSLYPQFSLYFWNLAIACARCNGKKTNNDWQPTLSKTSRRYPASGDLSLFHPVFDRHTDHIWMRRISDGSSAVAIFKGLTPKGIKLCEDLLVHIAMEETRVAANPDLAAARQIIEAHVASKSAANSSDCRVFLDTLSSVFAAA